MKNKITFALVISSLLLSAGLTFFSSHLCEDFASLINHNVKAQAKQVALEWSNELPGPQGQRHSQAVQCKHVSTFDVWDIQPGCCYGSENCSMNGCHRSFSCDGKHYL